jgi:tight adherence protein C
MDTSIILLVLLFWFFIALTLRNWFVYSQEKKKLLQHIQDVTETNRLHFKKKEKSSTRLLIKIFKYGDDFSALGQRINFFSERHEVENWLRKAGYPYDLTVERFQGIKMFFTIVGFVAGFVGIILGLPLSQFGVTVLPILGYFGVIMALKNKAKKRQEELRYDLPDFLDTVSVSLRAGVSLDQTLREVVKYFSGPLHEEFSRFNQEISLGVPREEAYRDLLKRNDNPEFQSLIKSLIQGVKLGVPIATTFKLQAEDMRVIRKELAKEKAAKASPKVTLITTFVVAPTAIIMIAGLMILNMLFSDGGIASVFG